MKAVSWVPSASATVLTRGLSKNALLPKLGVILKKIILGILTQTLIFSKGHELLDHRGKQWRISAGAYPAVRRFMAEEGYLTDEF